MQLAFHFFRALLGYRIIFDLFVCVTKVGAHTVGAVAKHNISIAD